MSLRVVRDVYERYGFEPLETPAFENIETLLGKYGEEGNKLIFKILKRGEHEGSGEADLALRYDLTVPLARVVAQYQNELPKFFKRYQIQPVWRADRPARGRFREFYQCDIDAIGSTSPVVEAELLGAVGEVLTRLGFQDFVVRLNHRRLLSALLEQAGLPRRAARGRAHLHRQARQDWSRKESSATWRRVASTRRPPQVRGDASSAFRRCRSRRQTALQWLAAMHGAARRRRAVADLRRDPRPLRDGTPAAGSIRLDPSLARGLSYYTGAIMEIAVPDLAGSLGGGGRYDNLIGMFLGRDVPACGFSLGLERIIVVMTERKMFPDVGRTWRGGRDGHVRGTTSRGPTRWRSRRICRRAGLRVDVYPEPDKLGKQFKYASSRNAPLVAIVGDDERGRGEVTVKDLRSGDAAVGAKSRRRAHRAL